MYHDDEDEDVDGEDDPLYCVQTDETGPPTPPPPPVRPSGGPGGGYGCKCMPDMFDVETESEKNI